MSQQIGVLLAVLFLPVGVAAVFVKALHLSFRSDRMPPTTSGVLRGVVVFVLERTTSNRRPNPMPKYVNDPSSGGTVGVNSNAPVS